MNVTAWPKGKNDWIEEMELGEHNAAEVPTIKAGASTDATLSALGGHAPGGLTPIDRMAEN